jgi:hypothetical protein
MVQKIWQLENVEERYRGRNLEGKMWRSDKEDEI